MSTFTMGGVLSMAAKWVDGSATATDAVQVQLPLSGGTGSGQANSYWRMSISIPAGDTHNIDLTALAASYFGGSVSLNLASVKVLMLRNLSTRTPLTVNASATNAWTPFKPGTIGIDSVVMLREGGSGRAVSSTSKIISVVNGATTTSLAGTATGTTITGLSSTSGLYAGMLVGGTHPSGTTIATIASSTSVTTSAAVTTNGAGTFAFTPPPAVLDVLVVGVLA